MYVIYVHYKPRLVALLYAINEISEQYSIHINLVKDSAKMFIVQYNR